MKPNCKKINELLIAYCEGTLDREAVARVKAHVDGCEDCRGALASYKASWEMMGTGDELEPQSDYVSRFWTALAERQTWHETLAASIKEWFVMRRPAYRYAFVIAMIIAFNISVYKSVDVIQTRQMLANMSQEELEMMMKYDVVTDLDLLSDFDVVESLDGLDIT